MLLNNPPLGTGTPGGVPDEPASLLFVGMNYAPEMIGIGPFTAGLAEEMARRGHAVEVVTGHPHHPRRRAEWTERGWSRSVENGVAVRRTPLSALRRPTTFARVLQALGFVLAALVPLLHSVRSRRPDIVVGIAPALSAALLAFLLARALGRPFWLHLHRLRASATAREEPSARLVRRLEDALLARADQVSCVSDAMAEAAQTRGVPREKMLTLPNWANHADAIGRASGAAVRRELGAGRRTVAMYSGGLDCAQGPELVVEAARRLRERRDILFVVCGEGPARARLEEQAAGLANMVFRPLVPAAEFAVTMRAADIHLLPQQAGASDLVLPSKLANMLAAGKPVVATAGAGTELARDVMGAGLVVPAGDAAALARAVGKLADDRELAQAFGAEGRRRALARWSLDLTADRFERRVQRVLRRRDRLAGERSRAALPVG